MKNIAEIATTYYENGLNCAQAVLQSSLDDDGDTTKLIHLAEGMGGGLGDSGNLCGAINGAFLALSHYYGSDPRLQPIFHQLVTILKREYPSFQCRDIKDEENLVGRKSADCLEVVGRCAELCQKFKKTYPRLF